MVAFEEAMRAARLPTPRTLLSCGSHRVVVSELVPRAVTGAELAGSSEFTERVSYEAGLLVGRLHSTPALATMDADPLPQPDLANLEALALAVYLSLSAAEIGFWRTLQSDAVVRESLTRLRAWEERAPLVPAHCDVRLDQFLVSDGVIMLTDGEEFRLADPARDVGSYAGEWLFQAVTGLTDIPGEEAASHDLPPSHEEVVRNGAGRLAERRPLIAAFWRAYRECRAVDADLALRATAFAGWHLMDRAMAGAALNSRLTALSRAAMGIGRQAMHQPHRFVASLGLGGPA
jgi:hypothetical protein